jgi:L-aminopeptidase/D-esterase-like protein
VPVLPARPEPSGDLTDVPGVRVGHWTDPDRRTGCTVVLLPDEGAVGAVDVRGAAPGTRETDLLRPGNAVQVVHAVLLTGGSVYGLAAADGVVRRLEERGVGLPTPAGPVPAVPAAVLYDLEVGRSRTRPDAAAGWAACLDAERGGPCGLGRRGAGTGARVGKLFGVTSAADGGIGTASLRLPGGGTVGAVAAVNAIGDVVDADGSVLAGPGTVARLLDEGIEVPQPIGGTSTTLVVVATDLVLDRVQAQRLTVAGHDGLARAVHPVHTAYDGDAVFAVATGRRPADPGDHLLAETAAAEVVAAAVRRAVRPA